MLLCFKIIFYEQNSLVITNSVKSNVNLKIISHCTADIDFFRLFSYTTSQNAINKLLDIGLGMNY